MTRTRRLGPLALAAAALLIGLAACKPVAASDDPKSGPAAAKAGPAAPPPAGPPPPSALPRAAALPAPTPPAGYTLTPYLSAVPRRSFTQPGEALEEGKDYAAVIETSKGLIVADLFEDRVPTTVNSFVWLARNRFYDGVPFHRVIEGFMAQTGDPTGTGSGGPGYQFGNEIRQDLRHDAKGVLSMANAGPDTNGSQFFITFAPAPTLDGKYTVFGRVTEGEDVLDRITRIEPGQPGTPDVVRRIYIVEKPA